MFPTILIVDDEPTILQTLGGLLSDEGFEVLTAGNGYEGLKLIEETAPDLVLLDIWMPGIDGIETLRKIKAQQPRLQVIVITGHGNVETAVRATKLGAFDLIEKPLDIDRVIVDINNALHFRRLEEENRFLRRKTMEKHSLNGVSAAVRELQRQIAVVAPTDAWILISGENGAGKELVARNIHQFSRRAEEPLLDINCAALPADRLEDELFGHEKGAFEGAEARRKGGLEMAHAGTLFLDEVTGLSPETQARLLRVLQEGKFQRIGGGRNIHVDVRIVAATNRDLEAEIAAGRFREDLYFRLNEIPIHVPPLRERREDVPALTRLFLAERARRYEGRAKEISDEALELLAAYPWPGNVRELKNLIGRLVITLDRDRIEAADIPAPYNPEAGAGLRSEESLFAVDRLDAAGAMFEREFLRRKLLQFGGDPERAAGAAGLAPADFRARMEAGTGDGSDADRRG
jgi:two-component system, NtrC family, nitrogen regulation response regulator NtrX